MKFVENDLTDLLLSTCIDKDVRSQIATLVAYLVKQKPETLAGLFEEFNKTSKKDLTQSLKTLASDYFEKHPEMNLTKIVKETPILFSLLLLSATLAQ